MELTISHGRYHTLPQACAILITTFKLSPLTMIQSTQICTCARIRLTVHLQGLPGVPACPVLHFASLRSLCARFTPQEVLPPPDKAASVRLARYMVSCVIVAIDILYRRLAQGHGFVKARFTTILRGQPEAAQPPASVLYLKTLPRKTIHAGLGRAMRGHAVTMHTCTAKVHSHMAEALHIVLVHTP